MRGFGVIPDREDDVADDLRERRLGALAGASFTRLPTRLDYSAFLDRVPDQGGSNSCVGWAFSTSILLRSRIAGRPAARPSAKAIYDIARLIDTPRVLADVGARPRAALLGMLKYGLVDERRWPLTEANVDVPPPLDVFRAGFDAVLAGYYRLGGADIAAEVRFALVRGLIPIFGMPVDDAFLNHDDGTPYEGLVGDERGRHAMAIVGYGPGYIRVANSWGTGWGTNGFGRVTDEALNAHAFDVLVPSVLPASIL